jgi:hypothetical protein
VYMLKFGDVMAKTKITFIPWVTVQRLVKTA